MDFLELVLLITTVVVLAVAIFCQIKDQDTLDKIPYVDTLPEDQQKDALENLACYDYNNGVNWRTIYFASIIVSILFCYILPNMLSMRMFFLSLIVVFTVFYLFNNMVSFHQVRVICSRAKSGEGFSVSS
jgi:hypothetical protein